LILAKKSLFFLYSACFDVPLYKIMHDY